MLRQTETDEQLLDGVAMTMSISCSPQNQIDQYQLSDESQVLSDEIDIRFLDVSNHISQKSQQSRYLYTSKRPLIQTVKTKHRVRVDNKTINNKTNSKKNWQAIFQLDDQLFEVHYLGILENTQNIVQKISQLVLTEQYSKIKVYEKQLIEVMRQIQFGLNEYEKQKKSLINQINLLKADNEHLNGTISQLHTIIQDLQKAVTKYFQQNQLKDYISNNNNQNYRSVPFARTFLHSLQQINLIENQQIENYISIKNISQFILDLQKQSQNIFQNNYHTHLKSNSLYHNLCNNSSLKNIIDHIIANFAKINQIVIKNQYFNPYLQCCSQKQNKVDLIQIFLQILSKNRNNFLKAITESPDQNLYLWYVIHTSLITFLGIMIQQIEAKSMEVSFGDHTKYWFKAFLTEIDILIQKSGIKFTSVISRHYVSILRFMNDINSLLSFRMMRIN